MLSKDKEPLDLDYSLGDRVLNLNSYSADLTSARAIRQEKGRNGIRIGREEVKLSYLCMS